MITCKNIFICALPLNDLYLLAQITKLYKWTVLFLFTNFVRQFLLHLTNVRAIFLTFTAADDFHWIICQGLE